MQSNRFRYFRWTPRTAWITVAYVVVVPSIVGLLAYRTDVSVVCVSLSTGGPLFSASEHLLDLARFWNIKRKTDLLWNRAFGICVPREGEIRHGSGRLLRH